MRIHILHFSTATCYWNSRRNAIVLHNSVMVGADSVDTPEHDAASSWQTPEHVRHQAQQRQTATFLPRDCPSGGESTLDSLCKSTENSGVTASTSRHWKPQESLMCGNDSILRANVTRDMGSPCLGAVGASVWWSALLSVGFSVLVSILLRSLSMSGAALMRALRLRGSCS